MQKTLFVLILINLFNSGCTESILPSEQLVHKDTTSNKNLTTLSYEKLLTAEDSFAQELLEIKAILEDVEDMPIDNDTIYWEWDYNKPETFDAEIALLDTVSLENWATTAPKTFKTQQLQFLSVQNAYASHKTFVQKLLMQQGINSFEIDLYLRAFKDESEMEIWAKPKKDKTFRLLTTYHFYKGMTELGPKQREGDWQVPEGCYFIDYFNPHSDYILSLRINYPNAVDSIRNAHEAQMGSAICIHGNVASVGCLAMTDLRIPMIYILATEAMDNGQTQIPVHIFPYRMTTANQYRINPGYPQNHDFWRSLEIIYKEFERTKNQPKTKNSNGLYTLENP
ncbi:MAG: hypothetical protein GY810_20580 [Aureispira sp.]|nr:hypothetical protein [Aureispira sp.]